MGADAGITAVGVDIEGGEGETETPVASKNGINIRNNNV